MSLKRGSNMTKRVNIKKLEELRERLVELPEFIFDFIQRYIKNTTALSTKIAYCKDFKIFFNFLMSLPKYSHIKCIKDFTINDLKKLEKIDIENYLLYLEYYTVNYKTKTGKDVTITVQNDNYGKMRKLSSLRSLFDYLYSSEIIDKDITKLVRMPKINQKIKSKLSVDEVVLFLDSIEKGKELTRKERVFFNLTKTRDIAIVTVLLGTGIRVSELVNLNIDDINFKEGYFKVIRKGQNEELIFCNDEVTRALKAYYDERIKIKDINPEHQNAFFLSTQNKRINERTVRNMIKKYIKKCGIIKNITPHSLRRTFGTNLYNEIGDIYLVAELLGHKSVETTKKHYAELDIERKRQALKQYKLRDENKD